MEAATQAELTECPVLILVGGLGLRLRSVYDDGPKVMASVNGRPFLWYLLNSLAHSGFRNVVLCGGYRFGIIRNWLDEGGGFGFDISYSVEEQALGTAGALRLAYSRYIPDHRFFALNGDSFLQVDFAKMHEHHRRGGTLATLALAEVSDTSRYGAVDVDYAGRVRSFREKDEMHTSGSINGGVYLFEPEVMNLIPDGRPVSLEREILPLLAARGLRAFSSSGYFIDIGVPEDYRRAQTELGDRVR